MCISKQLLEELSFYEQKTTRKPVNPQLKYVIANYVLLL